MRGIDLLLHISGSARSACLLTAVDRVCVQCSATLGCTSVMLLAISDPANKQRILEAGTSGCIAEGGLAMYMFVRILVCFLHFVHDCVCATLQEANGPRPRQTCSDRAQGERCNNSRGKPEAVKTPQGTAQSARAAALHALFD